jgi:hypothetical protein
MNYKGDRKGNIFDEEFGNKELDIVKKRRDTIPDLNIKNNKKN